MRVAAVHILLVLLAICLHLNKGAQADTTINDNNSPDDFSELEFSKQPLRRLASGHGAHGGVQAGNNGNNGVKPDAEPNNDPPAITYIIGFRVMCMQASDVNARVYLANCVKELRKQQWAFYGDGTIRLHSDPSLCLTSDGRGNLPHIILLNCLGWSSQVWTFTHDRSILNPSTGLVMDVRGGDVTSQEIILYSPKGSPNQVWVPF